MQNRVLLALAALAVALMLVPAATSASPQVLSPAGEHYGKTFPQWTQQWWRWALGIPVHFPPGSTRVIHPLVDRSGVNCGVGQSGPVWFLGGAFFANGNSLHEDVTRDGCVVPIGKALFFPTINGECTAAEALAGCPDEAGSRAFLGGLFDTATASSQFVEVDGVKTSLASEFRVGAGNPSYCVFLPPDDILSWVHEPGITPGISCHTVDDGYYAMVAPLSAGKHTVHFHGEILGSSLDVTYHLVIQ